MLLPFQKKLRFSSCFSTFKVFFNRRQEYRFLGIKELRIYVCNKKYINNILNKYKSNTVKKYYKSSVAEFNPLGQSKLAKKSALK